MGFLEEFGRNLSRMGSGTSPEIAAAWQTLADEPGAQETTMITGEEPSIDTPPEVIAIATEGMEELAIAAAALRTKRPNV